VPTPPQERRRPSARGQLRAVSWERSLCGEPINSYGDGSRGVREFYLANVRHWIEEYHLDGLRLDATQCVFDRSEPHILSEITREVRASADGRNTLVIAETSLKTFACDPTRMGASRSMASGTTTFTTPHESH
jgi:1,4-alpha-glucan branching enzyme